MTKAANQFRKFVHAIRDRPGASEAQDDEQKLLHLRQALIAGEASGDAEPGSFDRMRAAIRAAARKHL